MTEDDVYADWSALRVIGPAAAALLVLAVGGFVAFRAFSPEPELSSTPATTPDGGSAIPIANLTPEDAAALVLTEFLDHLEDGRFNGLTFAFSEPPAVQDEYGTITGELGGFTISTQPGAVTLVDAANATAPVLVNWTLEDGVVFETETEVDLVLVGTEWQVDWEPSILEQSLDPGDVLVRERVTAPRAPILGRDDVPLVDNRPIVNVSVIPRRSDDIAGLSASLGQLLGLDPGEIQATIAPSPSDSKVFITSRRVEDIASIQGQLSAIPGVVLDDVTYPLAPDERFARALLGRSAEVTAEILEASPEIFIAGDVAGRSGLQRLYNERLAGTPGFQVRVKRRFPTAAPVTGTTTSSTPDSTAPESADGSATEADGAGAVDAAQANPDIVYLSAPGPGTALRLTIDQEVQRAAENALAQTELPSALVAIEVSTGQILAVANGPGASVNNFAMTGQYAPGSIFKTVTAYAAMENGVGLTDPVDCPLFLNVNGRDFTNAEGEVLGTVPMRRAYVLSCNTAFINLAGVLDPSDFPNTAAKFGIGTTYSLGTDAFSGNVPTPGGPVEKAATSFGQSQVLVSPLSAAVMAASAAGGAYRPPQLVIEPGTEPPAEQPLNPALSANLREIMRAVVTNGTGRAVSNVAGGPVAGKTGTAEFGNENPPQAHAWFVGFQGDVAFAVFVEGGEFGGATATPIAGNFLNQLAG